MSAEALVAAATAWLRVEEYGREWWCARTSEEARTLLAAVKVAITEAETLDLVARAPSEALKASIAEAAGKPAPKKDPESTGEPLRGASE